MGGVTLEFELGFNSVVLLPVGRSVSGSEVGVVGVTKGGLAVGKESSGSPTST